MCVHYCTLSNYYLFSNVYIMFQFLPSFEPIVYGIQRFGDNYLSFFFNFFNLL
jgi:hypothetical protein